MADRLVINSKSVLDQIDKRFGKDATYKIFSIGALDPVTGIQPRIETTVPNIKVRKKRLSKRQLDELTQAGVKQVETSLKIQSKYVSDVKVDAEIDLTESGESYIVIDSELDDLELDFLVFVREKRSG